MMDAFELAEELYPDYRADYGDGSYAYDAALEEARKIIRCQNVCQDAWEDFERDFWIDRDNEIRSPNQDRPTRDTAREFVGDVAVSVLTTVAVRILDRGIDWVIDWFRERFNVEKAQAAAPSVSNRLDRLEVDFDELRQKQVQMQESLKILSLPNVA